MRVSVDESDPGFANGNHWLVYLDGVELRGVFTADEERRLVVQADFDEQGRMQLDRSIEPPEVKRVKRYGHVRLEAME